MSKENYLGLADVQLWKLLREGDRSALDEVYRRNIDILYSYGAKITSDSALVEDSIQEIFITIWEKKDKLKDTTSIKFYLFKSLKRRIFRNLKKSQKFGFQYDFSEAKLADKLKTEPATEALDDATIKKIHQSLAQLTNRQKEIVYLRFYAKLDFSEVAEIMELSIKATYKLQARAIQRLKENFILSFMFF